MTSPTTDLARIADALEALRREVAQLRERVAALEGGGTGVPPVLAATGGTPAPPAVPPADGLSEELVVVISAAIAAYLGKRPHIRQIRLLRSDAWAQQGRATVQASHVPRAPTTRSAP
jgi:methylmalonyl-CoA carboxyltransferase large subunit